jgi:hypothetical protein
MQVPKLDVFVAFLTFGGNGSVSTIIPSHSDWLAETALKASKDERVGRFDWGRFGDIPLDVERNKIVQYAKDNGYDVLIMLDSDNFIDKYVGHNPEAKPFWDSSFHFLYQRKIHGLPTVVCCPYCGPPPDDIRGGLENVYVFYFGNKETRDPDAPLGPIELTAYTRDHAAMMTGIHPIGAGPTGVIMYSMDSFDLFPPTYPKEQILDELLAGKHTKERAIQLLNRQGWFFYETDHRRTKKESTEDVTNTREIQLAGVLKHHEPVVFCNWDSWAGHWKPKCVGKPTNLPIEAVCNMFRHAVESNVSVHDRGIYVDTTDSLPPYEGPIMEIREDEPKQESVQQTEIVLGEKVDLSKEGVSKESLERVNQVASGIAASGHARVITLNDQTGIVSHSVIYKNKNIDCYRIVDQETMAGSTPTKDGGRCAEIKRVNYDQFEPQDVDLIVYSYSKIQPENAFDAIEALKHVKEGGKMLVLTKSDEHAKAFSDDFLTWNLKHCECVAEGSIVHIQVNRQG